MYPCCTRCLLIPTLLVAFLCHFVVIAGQVTTKYSPESVPEATFSEQSLGYEDGKTDDLGVVDAAALENDDILNSLDEKSDSLDGLEGDNGYESLASEDDGELLAVEDHDETALSSSDSDEPLTEAEKKSSKTHLVWKRAVGGRGRKAAALRAQRVAAQRRSAQKRASAKRRKDFENRRRLQFSRKRAASLKKKKLAMVRRAQIQKRKHLLAKSKAAAASKRKQFLASRKRKLALQKKKKLMLAKQKKAQRVKQLRAKEKRRHEVQVKQLQLKIAKLKREMKRFKRSAELVAPTTPPQFVAAPQAKDKNK